MVARQGNRSRLGMAVGPTNETRWRHAWTHHNRGIVWNPAVCTLAQEEYWTNKRDRLRTKEDNNNFITGIMMGAKERRSQEIRTVGNHCERKRAKHTNARRLDDPQMKWIPDTRVGR